MLAKYVSLDRASSSSSASADGKSAGSMRLRTDTTSRPDRQAVNKQKARSGNGTHLPEIWQLFIPQKEMAT